MSSRRIVRYVVRYLIRKSDFHIALTVLLVGLGLGWCIENPTEIPGLLVKIKEVAVLAIGEIKNSLQNI